MKSVAEYKALCLSVSKALPPFAVNLAGALGCVLAQDVVSFADLPVRDTVLIEGYAVRSADLRGASAVNPVKVPVIATVVAGSPEEYVVVEKTAIRVAAGVPLPQGADCVVPLRATDSGVLEVSLAAELSAGENVRARASDLAAGEVILQKGLRISSRHIAILAAAGHDTVMVHPKPRVVIMAIGNGLQDPGRSAQPGMVFDANSHAIASAAADAGADVFRVGVVGDDPIRLREILEDQLVRADILITTGGIGNDGSDTLKHLLESINSVHFDRVAMSDGLTLGVGKLDNTSLFALPGNPVSALSCFEVFIRPALRQMAGYSHIERRSLLAKIQKGWHSLRGSREFVPAKVAGSTAAGYTARPLGEPGVKSLSDLSKANCFIILPEEIEHLGIGDFVECIALDR
ncbi:MAG: molybdopterin molybdotransferase MoeA [Arcanobacterium sp.]|nr:molybdopterin molybdotransferase MoeA [Arcanobacterium sp.]